MDAVIRLCVDSNRLASSGAVSPRLSAPVSSTTHHTVTPLTHERSADHVAALLCFYINRYGRSGINWDVDPGRPADRFPEARGTAVAARKGKPSGNGVGDVRAALEASFRFLLSMLAAGAAQHPALRRWLWSGVGAVPFTAPAASPALRAGDGPNREHPSEPAPVEGGEGCPWLAKPFPCSDQREINEAATVASTLPTSATDFVTQWAFTALRRQEEALLLSRQCRDRGWKEEYHADPARTTALRLSADAGGDGGLPGPCAAYQLAEALLLPYAGDQGCKPEEAPSRNAKHSSIALGELPPLAAAYALLESPQRRYSSFVAPLLHEPLQETALEGAASNSLQPVFLAFLPRGGGVHYAVGEDGYAPDVCALPAGFEQRLHFTFTELLLQTRGPSASLTGPLLSYAGDPCMSEVGAVHARYQTLRSSPTYEGAMAAAAAMLGYELQASACVAFPRVLKPGNRSGDDVSVKAEGDGVGHCTQGEGLQGGEPLHSSLQIALWQLQTHASQPSEPRSAPVTAMAYKTEAPEEDTAVATDNLRRCGTAWSALLAVLALSDGPPGQFVRSVLEPCGIPTPADTPLPSVGSRLRRPKGGSAEALRVCGDDDDEEAVRGLGFGEELFLPCLEELEECPSGDAEAWCRSLLHLSPTLQTPAEPVIGTSSGFVGVLHSAATLVATALRHPGSLLHQLDQIAQLVCFLATAPSGKGRPARQPPGERRRKHTAASEPLLEADAREDLSRRLTNLFGVYLYSCLTGLRPLSTAPSAKTPQGDAGARRLTTSPAPGDHTGTAAVEVRVPATTATVTEEGDGDHSESHKDTASAVVKREAGEPITPTSPCRQDAPTVLPPPPLRPSASSSSASSLKLRLKLPLGQKAKVPAVQPADRGSEDGAVGFEAPSGLACEAQPTYAQDDPSVLKSADAGENAEQTVAAPAGTQKRLLAPRIVLQCCWNSSAQSTHSPGADRKRERGTEGGSDLKPISELVSHALQMLARELAHSTAPAPVPVNSRRVLSLTLPAHVKAFNECVDAIAAASEGCFCVAAPPIDPAGEVEERVTHAEVAVSDLLHATLGGCVTFLVYRFLLDLLSAATPSATPEAATRSAPLPAKLSHVAAVLHPFVRSSRVRALPPTATRSSSSSSSSSHTVPENRAAAVPVAPPHTLFPHFFFHPTLSLTLLPRLLDQLAERETQQQEERRRAAAEAEADRRRRGVLALNLQTQAPTPVKPPGAASPTLGTVEDLKRVLQQLAMVL